MQFILELGHSTDGASVNKTFNISVAPTPLIVRLEARLICASFLLRAGGCLRHLPRYFAVGTKVEREAKQFAQPAVLNMEHRAIMTTFLCEDYVMYLRLSASTSPTMASMEGTSVDSQES